MMSNFERERKNGTNKFSPVSHSYGHQNSDLVLLHQERRHPRISQYVWIGNIRYQFFCSILINIRNGLIKGGVLRVEHREIVLSF